MNKHTIIGQKRPIKRICKIGQVPNNSDNCWDNFAFNADSFYESKTNCQDL